MMLSPGRLPNAAMPGRIAERALHVHMSGAKRAARRCLPAVVPTDPVGESLGLLANALAPQPSRASSPIPVTPPEWPLLQHPATARLRRSYARHEPLQVAPGMQQSGPGGAATAAHPAPWTNKEDTMRRSIIAAALSLGLLSFSGLAATASAAPSGPMAAARVAGEALAVQPVRYLHGHHRHSHHRPHHVAPRHHVHRHAPAPRHYSFRSHHSHRHHYGSHHHGGRR